MSKKSELLSKDITVPTPEKGIGTKECLLVVLTLICTFFLFLLFFFLLSTPKKKIARHCDYHVGEPDTTRSRAN